MRIVLATERHSEGMGYCENVWPGLMAARGHEVHIVTSTMQVYGDAPFYHEVYGRFLGPPIVAPGHKVVDGVHVIRLPVFCWWRRFRLTRGGIRAVLKLRPDIVQTFDPRSLQTLLLSAASLRAPFKLFTSEHSAASVYPAYHSLARWPLHQRLYLRLTETVLGWLACRRVAVCYASTPDSADIAVRFHGVRPASIRRLPLGVDTGLFHPCLTEADQDERRRQRAALGVAPEELLCIYTGRFTGPKNPLCLAQAVEILRRQGRPFRAVFLGDGEQAAAMAAADGCWVKAFTPYPQLGRYYRAADIGVWPCQESVGMLDAAACGLPIVVGDHIMARERVDGNGLTYAENDPASLAEQLARLQDAQLRIELGRRGTEKMRAQFSVERVIDVLLNDYAAALQK